MNVAISILAYEYFVNIVVDKCSVKPYIIVSYNIIDWANLAPVIFFTFELEILVKHQAFHANENSLDT